MSRKLRERLGREILILDGSMGAILQERGLPLGYAPDLWNLENPRAIEDVHKEYVAAGCNIILTNTFGANRLRLAEYGQAGKVREINAAGVELARRAANGKAFVAGDIGPTGTTVAPFGEIPLEDAVSLFKEQARALAESGVDAIAIETIFDLQEIKAAVIAAKEAAPGLPIIAMMTFNQDGLTDTGTDPETAVSVLEGLEVDVIGANCSIGPEHMLYVIQRMSKSTSKAICVEPNAGLPVRVGAKTIYPATAGEMASYADKFLDSGASIIGGCCGTTPEYVRLISGILRNKTPNVKPSSSKGILKISSRTRTISIGSGEPFTKIGEKINPTGRKSFAEAIAEKRTDIIVAEARKQKESGADALDVNVGVPLIDEAEMMGKAVTAIQNVVDLPLVIDSSQPSAIERGLSMFPGRALINSVNAEEEKIELVLPLVKRYGSSFLALCAGTEIPESAIERVKNAEKIIRRMDDFGISHDRVIFDPLALTVSAMPEASRATLETIRIITKELGFPTSLGLSNVSFGLPGRKHVHNAFLAMAIASGLDAAIVNPYDEEMHEVVYASSLFAGRDPGCRKYIEFQVKREEEKREEPQLGKTRQPGELLWNSVVEGHKEAVPALIEATLGSGMSPLSVFVNIMTPAIRHLGDLFGKRKKFIPHLVAAAEAMNIGVEILKPLIEKSENMPSRGTIIMATVKGDIHDIGKKICSMMLGNFGFRVIDLGRNVSCEEILKSAAENKAHAIGLSALMTTTMMYMKTVIRGVRERGLPCKVVVGGAVLNRKFADEVGADGYSKDVGDVVGVFESIIGTEKIHGLNK